MSSRSICNRLLSIFRYGHFGTHGFTCSLSTAAGNIYDSPHTALDLVQKPLPIYLFDKLEQHGDKTAVVDGITGQKYSFSQIKQCSIKVASALMKLGYKKGDVIGIHATNSPEYVILLLALPAAGIVMTTTNPAFTPDEIAGCYNISRPSCIVTIPGLLPIVNKAVRSSEVLRKEMKQIITIGEADGYRSFQSLMEDDGSAFPSNLKLDFENDLLVLPFSSGTTGFPKAVMLNHRSLVSNIQQLSVSLNTIPDDSLLGLLPFFHLYGLGVIVYFALQSGHKVVTLPKFEPELYLKTLQNHKISYLQSVPPMALFMAKHPMVSSYDLSALRCTLCGAAPVGDTLTEEYMDRFKSPLFQGYGMTECGPGCIIDTLPPTPGTVGKVMPNTKVKVVHPGTNDLVQEVGNTGEICLKGPQIMKGYYKNRQATEAAIIDGWMHTGDVGYVRPDGNVVITDRVKDLIKYKAFQIAPAEIENVLLKHPGIQDVAVIGVPDERAGEVPKAFIVPKTNKKLNENDISQFMKDKVAEFKQIRGGVQIVDTIPKTPSGKILRRILREQ